MGLSTNFDKGLIATPDWVERIAPSPERFMPAEVEFLDPTTRSVLLTCKARVQPLRSAVPKPNGATDTQQQVVLVSIPIALGRLLDLRPKHRAAVKSCVNNPTLTKFLYVVQEVIDSSNPVERTFHFVVDTEVVIP